MPVNHADTVEQVVGSTGYGSVSEGSGPRGIKSG